jgi:hypothetical protein
LRFVSGWLVGFLDGRAILSAYDSSYGIGSVGIRVGRENDAVESVTRTVLHEASVHWIGGES